MGEVVSLERVRAPQGGSLNMGQKPRPRPNPLPPVDKPLDEPIPQPPGDPIRGHTETGRTE
jgi:hypothetical protein